MSKYNAIKVIVTPDGTLFEEHLVKKYKLDVKGIRFDSKMEGEYYQELLLQKRYGEIKDFSCQPKFVLQQSPKITYVADFLVTELNGSQRVIDIKGVETSTFKVKLKLFKANYPTIPIEILGKNVVNGCLSKTSKRKRLLEDGQPTNYLKRQKGKNRMKTIPGMEMKFTVIKNEDIEKHLDDRDKSELSRILWKISQLRLQEGKNSENSYLVINVDEPYAEEVVDILKDFGHWGEDINPDQISAVLDGEVLTLPESEDQK